MWSYAQLKACVRVAIVGSWVAECLYVSLARQAAFEILTVVAFRGQVNFEVPPSTRDQWLNRVHFAKLIKKELKQNLGGAWMSLSGICGDEIRIKCLCRRRRN